MVAELRAQQEDTCSLAIRCGRQKTWATRNKTWAVADRKHEPKGIEANGGRGGIPYALAMWTARRYETKPQRTFGRTVLDFAMAGAVARLLILDMTCVLPSLIFESIVLFDSIGKQNSSALDGHVVSLIGHCCGDGKKVPRRRWKSRNGSSQNLTSPQRPVKYGSNTNKHAAATTTTKNDTRYPWPRHVSDPSHHAAVALRNCHGETLRSMRRRSELQVLAWSENFSVRNFAAKQPGALTHGLTHKPAAMRYRP